MRKWLAVVFLIIFSCQVLPVRSIGKLLAKGQTEEEVKHSCDSSDDDCTGGALSFTDFIYQQHSTYEISRPSAIYVSGVSFAWHPAVDLPPSHACEILSPPPNC